jgi:uncharacterized circularly permuted ATP-grasp superfamily protein
MDEAFDADGGARTLYRPLLEALDAAGSDQVAARIESHLEKAGVVFGSGKGAVFAVDPVPRLIAADEWKRVSAGLAQRAEALDRFIADAYGPREIVAAGKVPERVIESSELFEPWLRGFETPSGHWAHICGFDLIRDPEGELVVLEDNLRTPSGVSYEVAARAAVLAGLPDTGTQVLPVDEAVGLLRATLAAAAPQQGAGIAIVLTDGVENCAYFEHRFLAGELGVPLAEPGMLRLDRGRVWLQGERGREAVSVIYRRTDSDRLRVERDEGSVLAQLLGEAMANGTVAIVNAFGTGVADDKLSQRYVDEMIRFYLHQEPLISSVPTLDLDLDDDREFALENLDRLVVKPRSGFGGGGVVICPKAAIEQLDELRRQIAGGECGLIAQPMISLSTHPTWDGSRLAPRHVDLRVFAYRGEDGYEVAPGGLSRFAAEEGSLIVNSSQGGGAKDTWVLR